MSKGLRYLATARPDAAQHLLSFYKESTKALDDKTRHLIQIVTKVTVGTQRGLRQYAPKALQAGASKQEILDAVLMAFPAAGLNKVLDAIETLLEMELLPEMADMNPKTAPLPNASLGKLSDIPIGKMHCVSVQSAGYILYRTTDNTVKAWSKRCPHAKADLCKGKDHGTSVECRVHNWEFNLASGANLEEGALGLIPVDIIVQDDWIRLAN